MKKLANLIALFILVSVNVFTPITYAQEVLDELDKYNCSPEWGWGEWWQNFICTQKSDWEYLCTEDSESWKCRYNNDERFCEDKGDNILDCGAVQYSISDQLPNWWYNFTPSWDEWDFYCDYAEVWGLGLSNDLREMSSYWYYNCSWKWRNYYGCSESWNWFSCPQLYNYYLDRDKGTYIFYKDTDYWYYSCDLNDFDGYDHPEDASVVGDGGDYVCWDQRWYVNSCYEDTVRLPEESERWISSEPEFLNDDYELGSWYVCPISYSCHEEEENTYQEEGIYCYEEMSGEYECESNWPVVAKWLLSDIGGYSCSSRVNKYSCDWDESYWRFKCEEPSDDWDDECLWEGAEYDDELWQCVYKVPGYDGKKIVIMSSNLGATKNNLTWLYYQWWRDHGFAGYDGDTGGEESIEYQLSSEDMAIFDNYPVEEFSVWPTDADPCPEHFHVPSTMEWNNLLISWCENTAECDAAELTKHDSLGNHWALNDVSAGNNYKWNYRFQDEVYSFMDDLNFSLWGSLDGYHANMLGLMGDYWAKEFIKTDKNWNKSSWWFTVYPRWWLGPVPFISNHAASVRCFADAEEGVEVATPVALDLYIWWCAQQDMFTATSAIEVLEDSVLCNNDGYLWRKFVAAGEEVDLDDLDGFLPEWYNRTWYLDDYQTTKLTENIFTNDTRLYAFEEITPITLTVTKVRNDADNQDWIRPESVTVHLYEDNGSSPVVSSRNLVSTVTLSGGNEWTATVPNLLPFHNIDYIWEEDTVSWYEPSQNTDWFITTLTNTHTPAVATKFTVTFNSNSGSTINPVEVAEGQPVTKPTPDPIRNGYRFDGWTLNWEAFDFSEPITWHITLKAEWEILHYSIRYKDGEAEVQWLTPSSYTVEDNFILPTLPVKSGYKFDGWSDNGTKITSIQAGNTWNKTLVAIWTEDKPSWWNSGWYSWWGSSSKPSSKWSWPSSTEVESTGDGPYTPANEQTKTEPKPVVKKWANYTGKVNPEQELFDA